MAEVPLVVPDLGEQIARVRVVEWHKQLHATVALDELVVAVSTEKIDVDLGSPTGGTLTEIRVEVGEWAAVGATLAIISDG
ncbi:MAG: biotin/lipoyl-containing protein [Kofleriaceae bacterium]